MRCLFITAIFLIALGTPCLSAKCTAGYYCPPLVSPQPCQKGTEYCPAGSVAPQVCPGGHRCPGKGVLHKCEKGSYCLPGDDSIHKCSWALECPEGSTRPRPYRMLIAMVGVAVFVYLSLLGVYRTRRMFRVRRNRHSEELPLVRQSYSMDNSEAAKVDLRFRNLTKVLKDGRCILSGVTGTVKSGRVTAIMGPSGAGKTTFMHVLCGKTSRTKGEVYVNDTPASLASKEYAKIVGFVPQEDIVLRDLTVKQILRFAAKIRLPRGFTKADISRKVNNVINVLGLGKVKHVLIGDENKRGVSGGQRKRVNIGMELVSNPAILFLDEPTSGLDSTSAEEVAQCLRDIAAAGLTVVTVIHQPRYEIFKLIDDILLLAQGQTVYLGPGSEAAVYFQTLGFELPSTCNPADFLIDVISGKIPQRGNPNFKVEDLIEYWKEHERVRRNSKDGSSIRTASSSSNSLPSPLPTPPQASYHSTHDNEFQAGSSQSLEFERPTARWVYQFLLFFTRSWNQLEANLKQSVMYAALMLVTGAFLGVIFRNKVLYETHPKSYEKFCMATYQSPSMCLAPITDAMGGIGLLCALAIAFTAMAFSIKVFGLELVHHQRERDFGVRASAYFLGKVAAHLPLGILLPPALFLGPFMLLAQPFAHFTKFYLLVMLPLQFCGVGIGLWASVLVQPQAAQFVGVVLVLLPAMVSGVFPHLPALSNINPIPSLSFIRWGVEGFYITELKARTQFYSSDFVLDAADYKFSDLAKCCIFPMLLALSYFVLAYIWLRLGGHRSSKLNAFTENFSSSFWKCCCCRWNRDEIDEDGEEEDDDYEERGGYGARARSVN